MEKTQNNVQSTCHQFRRKNPSGSFTRGYGFWEDMAEKDSWEFVCQFLPDYERRDDVAASDDLDRVIDKEKPLGWLYEYYPQWDGLSIEELKKVRAQWDYELFREAGGYLAAAIQAGEIEVREFPVTTVSARIEGEGDNDRVWLQCAGMVHSNYRKELRIPSCHLQNVKSRWMNEGTDEEQFQVYFECKDSGDACWCNAQSIDFE